MDPGQIANLWRTTIGGQCPPAGYLCRDAIYDRWLRIHSLPGSKRYAHTEFERVEILRRQNEVATATLGERSPCVIFLTSFSPELYETQFNYWLSVPLAFLPVAELSRPESDEQDEVYVFAAEASWQHGGFNSLLTAVADDLTGQIMFANLWRGTAFHPYDGGADLFLESSVAVVEAKNRWSDWLSSRDDGM